MDSSPAGIAVTGLVLVTGKAQFETLPVWPMDSFDSLSEDMLLAFFTAANGMSAASPVCDYEALLLFFLKLKSMGSGGG
jgi:hypothetical protein